MEEKKERFKRTHKSYREVIKGKWKKAAEEFTKDGEATLNLKYPVTNNSDKALHLAVYSEEEEPTKTFLLLLEKELEMEEEPIMIEDYWKNGRENTPLHEAATVGNLAAVKLLVEFKKDDMLVKNIYGETPLYRAAKYGKLEIVEYFLDHCEDFYSRSSSNWTTYDHTPIIHAAIQSENFDVVLKLIEFDKSLMEMTDSEGRTGLYVLANMPLAFRSGYSMNFFESKIYDLLPEDIYKYKYSKFGSYKNNNAKPIIDDLEAGTDSNPPHKSWHSNCWRYFLHSLISLFWRFIFLGWPQWKEFYQKKQQHKLALTITKLLAHIDYQWFQIAPPKLENDQLDLYGRSPNNDDRGPGVNVDISIAQPLSDYNQGKIKDIDIKFEDHLETPLLLAAANGIIEIVEEIVEVYPQAVDYETNHQRNVLHVAIAHRKQNVFDWIQNNKLIMSRLVTRIDDLGFTALHHVGIMKFYRGGTHGPALQLKYELEWYERVKSQIPALYNMHHNHMKWTARGFFDETHDKMLVEAKEWLKKTSEACSAVAVLVATVVFAAAYTVPGGLNSKTGSPVLLTEPIYTVFTIMDIVALATSLTSVVLFLSILMSSFKMEDFLHMLPMKLSIGFQLLFFSVASTMMAFALTIVLTMKTEEMKWTVSLLYLATFFPVTMFIIIQLPLYVELVKNIWSYRHHIFKFLPMGFLALFWKLPSKILNRKFV